MKKTESNSYEMSKLAAYLPETVQAYFSDPQHMKEFKAWYKEKYGTEYIPQQAK